jgi:hypothetical protein
MAVTAARCLSPPAQGSRPLVTAVKSPVTAFTAPVTAITATDGGQRAQIPRRRRPPGQRRPPWQRLPPGRAGGTKTSVIDYEPPSVLAFLVHR